MAPASSEAPALATESQARNTNQHAVEFGVIGSVEVRSWFEDSEGAEGEIGASVHTHGAK